MKIIHCSDLHIDSPIIGLPLEKSKTRKEEILRTFEKMCDYAEQNDVSVVLICGDMFDSIKPSSKSVLRVFSAIEKCKNVNFLYLAGNHDQQFFNNVENLPNNFKIFNDKWSYYTFDNVVVAGAELKNDNFNLLSQSLSLNENKFNIVALHGEVVGYNSNEKTEVISIPPLKNKNIDYLALGHYHTYSEGQIDLRGKYVYSGCLDGRGFDELNEKGFVLIEIDQDKILNNSVNKYTTKFVEVSSRNFYLYEYQLSNNCNFYECVNKLLSELQNKFSPNSLLKVVLKGEVTLDYDIDLNYLTNRLNESFFYGKVSDKTTFKIDIKDYEFDKSVKGEFVRAVTSSSISDEQKQKILTLGIKAINGEEI